MTRPSDLKIIIIDDNPAIHQDFIKILTRTRDTNTEVLDDLDRKIFGDEGGHQEKFLPKFEIDTASQGQEGYERIAAALKKGDPYALAFVDIRMPPGWDGIETIQHIWELDKNIQIVICTAYSDYSWEETVEKLGHSDNLLILKKPFDNVAVRQLAVALTKKWQLMQKNRDYLASLEEKVLERTHSLEKSLSLTKATLESSNDGILVVDNEHKIVDFNAKFKDLLRVPLIILENGDYDVLAEYIQSQMINPDALNKEPARQEVNIDEIKLKNGLIFECYSQPHRLNENIVGRVWSYRDVTQRVQLEQQLHHQATHDELTGLPNRFLLMDKLSKVLLSDETTDEVALMFLDIDRFKLINDSLSHSAGDQLIKEFGSRLETFIDDQHIISRFGGDEFVVLITGVKSHDEIVQFATKIAGINKMPFEILDRKIIITTSIGISVYPSISKSVDELLQHSDAAMYYAKELGNNQFQFYTEELNKHNLQRLEKESELRQALNNNEFFLYYQPQIDITSEQLVAVEALIRWQHPTKGVILPLDFIPLAEETGIDVALGAWVMREACAQNKKWQDDGLKPIRVAVNVTSQQLKQPNAVAVVENILHETGLDPKYLELEVTENTIISDPIVGHTIADLKKLGLQIVLDDFGTGYSSLNYLKKIAIDGLKIDRSFIQNINVDRGDEVIIRAIIAMAHSLNLEVLAEGVESNEQLQFLCKQKCEDVQGFYFSQPLPANEIESLLKKTKEIV